MENQNHTDETYDHYNQVLKIGPTCKYIFTASLTSNYFHLQRVMFPQRLPDHLVLLNYEEHDKGLS